VSAELPASSVLWWRQPCAAAQGAVTPPEAGRYGAAIYPHNTNNEAEHDGHMGGSRDGHSARSANGAPRERAVGADTYPFTIVVRWHGRVGWARCSLHAHCARAAERSGSLPGVAVCQRDPGRREEFLDTKHDTGDDDPPWHTRRQTGRTAITRRLQPTTTRAAHDSTVPAVEESWWGTRRAAAQGRVVSAEARRYTATARYEV
jgi:hypothetical protein